MGYSSIHIFKISLIVEWSINWMSSEYQNILLNAGQAAAHDNKICFCNSSHI